MKHASYLWDYVGAIRIRICVCGNYTEGAGIVCILAAVVGTCALSHQYWIHHKILDPLFIASQNMLIMFCSNFCHFRSLISPDGRHSVPFNSVYFLICILLSHFFQYSLLSYVVVLLFNLISMWKYKVGQISFETHF
jgi:hypothetical protein